MPTPRTFFDEILKPSYDAWLADPLATWLAKGANANADIIAERMFRYWKTRDPSKIYGMKTVTIYREYLRNNVCPDCGLARDVHDGHKHMELVRTTRQVTSADQTGVGALGYGVGGFGVGPYGGGPQIVVSLDDGSQRALSAIVKNVVEFWEAQLKAMGL